MIKSVRSGIIINQEVKPNNGRFSFNSTSIACITELKEFDDN